MAEKNEEIEKTIEEKAEDFGEEMEKIGEKIGKEMQQDFRKKSFSQRLFGVLYPLLKSILGVLIIGVAILAVKALNSHLGSDFLLNLNLFLTNNLGIFFIILLIFAYIRYLEKNFRYFHKAFSPIFAAFAITVFFWIMASILGMVRFSVGRFSFTALSNIIMNNLWNIFIFFTIILYLIVMVKMNMNSATKPGKKPGKEDSETEEDREKEDEEPKDEEEDSKQESKQEEIKRLYRSSKEKILGGVAGGMAEYLKVDPVLLRLLWVALVFLSGGFGLIIYIICWIIIPRNPEHEW